MTEIIKRTIENLNKNKMETFFVEDRTEALKMALSLLNEGDTVSVGGSVTLSEIGMLDALKRGNYNYLDRYAASFPLEMHEIFRKSFFADAYITSSNAVTETGELYNVDGSGNRVAAMVETAWAFRRKNPYIQYDNRPLNFGEFDKKLNQVIYVSATPGPYELERAEQVVEQIIRPTGLLDPEVEVRPVEGQIDDLISEINKEVDNKNKKTLFKMSFILLSFVFLFFFFLLLSLLY